MELSFPSLLSRPRLAGKAHLQTRILSTSVACIVFSFDINLANFRKGDTYPFIKHVLIKMHD